MASKPNGRHDDEDDDDEGKVLEAARLIVDRLDGLAREQVTAKGPIEREMLKDERAYQGQYEVGFFKELDDADRSTTYVGVTGQKTRAWSARLGDLLHPTDDKNWGIGPTPLPKLAAAAKEAVAAAMAKTNEANQAADQADQAGEQGNPQQAQMMAAQAEATAQQAGAFAQSAQQTAAEIDAAKKACDAMEEAIDDQLIQSDYIAVCRRMIEDGCRLGTGIIKGPITSARTRQQWSKNEDMGAWLMDEIADPQPEYRWVDPWHFFPDMSASRIEDAEFTFERSLPTAKHLRRLALKMGFNKPAVRRLLRAGPGQQVNDADVTHLSELRGISGEGEPIKNRFVMWEYHGPLECKEVASLLKASGQAELAQQYLDDDDPLKEHRVILHFCGSEVLKIAAEWPLDSGDGLYSVWNFERSPVSIFGIGVPRILRDPQRAINGAARMMMDNAQLSVGPQVVVDKTAIAPQEGGYDLRALKVWLKTSTSLSSPNNPPFQVFNIPNNQEQLAGIIEIFKGFADEVSSMPLIAQGEAGAQVQPVGTTSMLFNSANVVFRRVVKSWDDDVTKRTIRRAYDWNMQFNPDEKVKGDMQVDARGTSVLLVREIQSQNLLMIMNSWTVHPVIKHYIKVRDGLVKSVQTMMIPPSDILLEQEEADRSMQQEQEQQAQAMAAAQQQGGGAGAAAAAGAQSRLEAVKLKAASDERIAAMRHDQAVMEIAQRDNKTITEVNAELERTRIKVDSDERRHAADIAVEDRRAATAAAAGESESDAVGEGVG